MLAQINRTLVCVLILTYVLLARPSFLKSDEQTLRMNEQAASRILNEERLGKLGEVWPGWKRRTMVWPSKQEIDAVSVEAGQKVKADCIAWLEKFMKDDSLPKGLEKHLVAMDNWGLFRQKAEQEKLCDVFICRFIQGPYVVQIQESPANVIISVADERLADKPKEKGTHKEFIVQVASAILHKGIIPDRAKDWFEFEPKPSADGGVVTRVQWSPPSVVDIDEAGRRRIDTEAAAKVGTFQIEAETNGAFVRFDIMKSPEGGPRLTRNPYAQRF